MNACSVCMVLVLSVCTATDFMAAKFIGTDLLH